MTLRFHAIMARFPAIPAVFRRALGVHSLLVDSLLGFGFVLLLGLTDYGQSVVGAGLVALSLVLTVVHYDERTRFAAVVEELRVTKEQLAVVPK